MNMRKILVAAVACAAVASAHADMKIGTVDMMKLVRNHSNYDSNKTLLTETKKDYEKKLDTLRSDLEAVQEEGKKLADQLQQPMLSNSAKTKMQKDLRDIEAKFMSGQQRLRSEVMRSQQDLQDLETRLLKTTSADIRKKIVAFAEKAGYDLVLDAAAAGYAKPTLDVTGEVLREMGVDPAKAVAVEPADEKSIKGSKALGHEGK